MGEECYYGPLDASVLHSQANHRSQQVYGGRTDWILTTRHASAGHTLDDLHPHVLHVLRIMGLSRVARSGRLQIDNHLITALVERWRPETHTFHLSFGEATVTLQDVAIIWGLPVDGDVVTGVDVVRTNDEWRAYCHKCTGFMPDREHLRGASALKLNNLREYLEGIHITDDTTNDEVQQYARGYALLLIGTLMMPNSSGHAVSLLYLQNIEDVYRAGQLSWGSACLSYMYRELCNAAQGEKENIGGAMVLLQIWAWSRIKVLVPQLLRSRINTGPRSIEMFEQRPYGARWVQHYSFAQTARRSLRIIRDILDRLDKKQWIWQPYDMDSQEIVDLGKMCLMPDLWCSTCPLINWEKVETHHPERVLRQFGLKQNVPQHMPDFHALLHTVQRKGHKKDWGQHHSRYIAFWRGRHASINIGVSITGMHDTIGEYTEWYQRITRRLISPSHLTMVSGYEPSLVALRESMISVDDASDDDHSSLVRLRRQAGDIAAEFHKILQMPQNVQHSGANEMRGLIPEHTPQTKMNIPSSSTHYTTDPSMARHNTCHDKY